MEQEERTSLTCPLIMNIAAVDLYEGILNFELSGCHRRNYLHLGVVGILA